MLVNNLVDLFVFFDPWRLLSYILDREEHRVNGLVSLGHILMDKRLVIHLKLHCCLTITSLTPIFDYPALGRLLQALRLSLDSWIPPKIHLVEIKARVGGYVGDD